MSATTPVDPPVAPRVGAGIALFLLAMFVFVAADTVAKALVSGVPVLQIAWVRYLVHGALLLLVIPKRGLLIRLATPLLPWHVLRAGCLVLTGTMFYMGLRHVPLAAAMTLVMTAPFVTAVLAASFLGERLSLAHWSAIALGFLGVLVVVRPGGGLASWGALFPLVAGASFSVQTLVSRRLARSESTWTMLVLTPLIAGVGVAPFALSVWQAPALLTLLGLVAIGAFATLGDAALINSLRLAPASTVAPFQYSQLVWASLLGFVFYAELPDSGTVIGAALIVVSGVILLLKARAPD